MTHIYKDMYIMLYKEIYMVMYWQYVKIYE